MSITDPVTQVWRTIFDTVNTSTFADSVNSRRMIDLTRGDILPTKFLTTSDFPTFMILLEDMDDTRLKATSTSGVLAPVFKLLVLTDKLQVANSTDGTEYLNPLLFNLFLAIMPLVGGGKNFKADYVGFGVPIFTLEGINISFNDEIYL